jgi:biopolymer transport protein ExbD
MRYFEVKKARIEIIPMIDIMFFLLVFFIMITLHMIPSSGIPSNLAKSTTATNLKHPKVVISLASDGSINVEGKQLTSDQLTALLRQKGDPSHIVVTIAGAEAATLQNVMHVMDACRMAGVVQIGLAAQKQN